MTTTQTEEHLEDIIERIWKKMCFVEFMYPNAWNWHIHLKFYNDWEVVSDDLIKAFKKVEEILKDYWS